MNPNFSSNNAANIRHMNPPPNTGSPGATGMYSPVNPQLRPRMEQLQSTGKMEINSNQPNFQPPLQYQRPPPNLMQHRPQQNLRFPPSGDLVRPQFNPNNNFQPRGAPFDGQRAQMGPPIRFPNPQQPIRPPIISSGEIPSQSNLPNQPLKMEPPKTPTDRPGLNHKTELFNNPPVHLSSKSSDLETNPSGVLNPGQTPNENSDKFRTNDHPAGDSKTSLLRREESKTESEQSIESDESEEVPATTTDTKKKDLKENKKNIIEDDGITSGMVQKNIKFFEQNDTAKKPLTPKTVTAEKKEKVAKMPSDLTKSDSHKDEFESGVDETPVVHPNLGSIFQIPRKVAKIPFLKENKRSRKLKSKRYFEQNPNKNYSHAKLKFSEFLKPPPSYFYKPRIKKNQTVKTYSPEEELLSFFENTKSWRKLSRYGSKANESAKDKVVHKPTTNGDIPTPKKTPSKLQTVSKKNPPVSPVKTPLKSPGTPGTPGSKLLPKTPESPAPPTPLIKKVPMNKIQVGAAPSPNLKTVRSKVGSLANTTHKPGGGNIKIESHKIDLSNVQPRTEAKNDQYKPSGGDKKIQQVKLQWSAQSKVGSLENATYKPGGGDKKIESVKLDFKEKAKSKVGSKDNVKHVPGGGNVKIENQKLEFKAQSKVGSLDNVKHKPGGGDIKIFDDKTYLRQVSGNSSEGRASGTQAHRHLSFEREARTRSAPGTPGRKTSIKLKKTTTIENFEEVPKVKKITEVVVTSHTPKTNDEIEKSPTKVKVTYSKISSAKDEDVNGEVGLIKIPAKQNAPVLKPRLSEKDRSEDPETGKRLNKFDFENAAEVTSAKNVEIYKQSSESPYLLQGKSNKRDDSGGSRFLQNEMTTQEKIGEIWQERNALDGTSLRNSQQIEDQRREQSKTSTLSNSKTGNQNQQFRFPNPGIKNGNSAIDGERNFYSSQNFQSQQFSRNPSFAQGEIQDLQRPSFNASEEYRISGSQQNRQNPFK